MIYNKVYDKLLSSLVGLARAAEGNEHMVSETTSNAVNPALRIMACDTEPDENEIDRLTDMVEKEKHKIVPNCYFCASPCGRTENCDMNRFWTEPEEIIEVKLEILRRVVKYSLNCSDSDSSDCSECRGSMASSGSSGRSDNGGSGSSMEAELGSIFGALYAVGTSDWTKEELMQVLGIL